MAGMSVGHDRAERSDDASLWEGVYRYFFYGWLFRDAASGSPLERAAALRHNRSVAKWLPTYLRRWLVAGAVIAGLQLGAEHAVNSAVLSAALAIALVLVLVFLVVTTLCWGVLRGAMLRD